jgi:hypothetical protein
MAKKQQYGMNKEGTHQLNSDKNIVCGMAWLAYHGIDL